MKRLNLRSFLLTIALAFCITNIFAQNTIKIAVPEYKHTVVNSNIMKIIFEEMGYNVELVSIPNDKAFEKTAKGEIDLYPEVWLPYTDREYMDKYKGNLEVFGELYSEVCTSLMVPDYVDISCISELNKNCGMFKKKIYGIAPTSSRMDRIKDALFSYDLDYVLVLSSEAEMIEELDAAYKQKKPILVTGWTPHTMIKRYGLKTLKDPKKIVNCPEKEQVAAPTGWSKRYPDLRKVIDNIRLTSNDLFSLFDKVSDDLLNAELVCKKWVEDNRDLVNSWMK